jgi:hypothetical protein
MGESAWSESISPTTLPGPDRNWPLIPTLGAFQHITCHHCTRHRHLIAEIWVGKRCSTCVEAWRTLFAVAPALRKMACHGPTKQLPFPLQTDWTSQPPLKWLHHCMAVCFKGFMVGASAADMAQHLVQPAAPSHHSHIRALITLRGLGKATG